MTCSRRTQNARRNVFKTQSNPCYASEDYEEKWSERYLQQAASMQKDGNIVLRFCYSLLKIHGVQVANSFEVSQRLCHSVVWLGQCLVA